MTVPNGGPQVFTVPPRSPAAAALGLCTSSLFRSNEGLHPLLRTACLDRPRRAYTSPHLSFFSWAHQLHAKQKQGVVSRELWKWVCWFDTFQVIGVNYSTECVCPYKLLKRTCFGPSITGDSHHKVWFDEFFIQASPHS